MKLIEYHEGQRTLQREAKTEELAESLRSTRVAPVVRNAALADLVVMATSNPVQFTAISGKPPLVQSHERDGQIYLRFPEQLRDLMTPGTSVGGLVTSLAEARRSRFSGVLSERGQHIEMECEIAFTNCRKYIAPSVPLADDMWFGPGLREAIDPADSRIEPIIAGAVTTFLGTITPQGMPDVSHRGGEPGFLTYDPPTRRLEWTEYLGDGMFASAGNIRAMNRFTLLVLNLESGAALEVCASGDYENVRINRKQPKNALVQVKEPYPTQGRIVGSVEKVCYLHQFCHPRRILSHNRQVTCDLPMSEQMSD